MRRQIVTTIIILLVPLMGVEEAFKIASNALKHVKLGDRFTVSNGEDLTLSCSLTVNR